MQSEPIVFKKMELIKSLISGKTAKKILSIDFGRAFVKIAYMESRGDSVKFLSCDLKKILSADEHRRQVVEFIGNFLKTNAVSEKEVYLTIAPGDSVVIKTLSLPEIPQNEILKAAKLELKDEIAFNLEKALSDWQLVREYTDEAGARKNEIIFILAEAEAIERYISIINECGLTCVRVLSGPFNYAQLLKHSKENPPLCAVLDIGYKDSTLCIYSEQRLVFSRRLNYSCDKITQALTTTLVSDIGKLELSYEEAENVKRHFGIPEETEQILEGNIQAAQITSLMRPLLEELARDLKHSFDYFKKNFQKDLPALLYLTGGGANLKNLDKYLYKQLNINISTLDFAACIDTRSFKKEELDSVKNQMVNATAAPLVDNRSINLLPEEIRTQKIELIEKVSLRLVAVAVGAIFFFSFFSVKLQISDYQNRLKNAQIHLQSISGIKTLKTGINLRENLIDTIQKGRVPVDGLLKLISVIIPKEVVLEELVLENQRDNLILKGKVMAGANISDSILTDFMRKIEGSSFFTEASLLSSKKIEQAKSFEIECELAD